MMTGAAKTAWIEEQKNSFLPASEVVASTVLGAIRTEDVAFVGTDQDPVFDQSSVLDPTDTKQKVATLEMGLWKLDGSCDIYDGSFPSGYVSSYKSGEEYSSEGYSFAHPQPHCSVESTTTFTETADRDTLTIYWGTVYGEYATDFTISVSQKDDYGNTRSDTINVTGNTSPISRIKVTPVTYTAVGDIPEVNVAWSFEIVVNKWSLPNRRARAEVLAFGDYYIWSGSEIIEFTEENSCDPLSLELPSRKCSVKVHDAEEVFQADNSNSKITELSDRQEMRIVYHIKHDGTIVSSASDVYYLSEWDSDSDGLTATFNCSSLLEWMDVEFKYSAGVTVEMDFPIVDLIYACRLLCKIDINRITHPFTASDMYVCKPVQDPNDETYYIEFNGATCAEVLQMIANARGCILRCTRDGKIAIEERQDQTSAEAEYSIPLSVCYEYPNLYLSKQLRSVNVNSQFGWKTVNNEGVDQTVENEIITSSTWANTIANWIANILKNRITIHGEYRADPVLDAGDIVEVETKRGKNAPFITNVSRRFNGGWSGSYDARCLNARWL